jgi:hypothetical protein
MNRALRLATVSLVTGLAVALPLLPVDNSGQQERGLVTPLLGPPAAVARIFRAISIPLSPGIIFVGPGLSTPVELAENGRLLFVGGHITCDPGERVRVRVTVSQESTGAIAEGFTQETCTGLEEPFELGAATRGPARFQVGPAQACALATTREHGTPTDAFQWCKDVTVE